MERIHFANNLQPAIYSIKVKLEFTILNKLSDITEHCLSSLQDDIITVNNSRDSLAERFSESAIAADDPNLISRSIRESNIQPLNPVEVLEKDDP
jgi:hypothetical protein